MTKKEIKALAAAQRAEEKQASANKPEAIKEKPRVRTLHDRYELAAEIIPPMKRKQSTDQAKLEHVDYVEKMTGKKIR